MVHCLEALCVCLCFSMKWGGREAAERWQMACAEKALRQHSRVSVGEAPLSGKNMFTQEQVPSILGELQTFK